MSTATQEAPKKYTLNEARQVVIDLVEAVRAKKDELDVPRDFLKEHPWSLKYLSHFAEADNLYELVKTPGLQMEELPMKETEARFRRMRKMPNRIRISVSNPEAQANNGRLYSMLFVFEERADGSFVCCNG